MTRNLVKAVLAAVLILGGAACKHAQEPPAPPGTSLSVRPGFAASLLALAQGALGCPDETLTWAVTEANGGAVTQGGVYTAPACGPTFVSGAYHVTATGCAKSVTFTIDVAEALTALEIYCAVVAPATCCSRPPIQVPPGGRAQFYAAVNYTCHTSYSPSTPPPMCP